MRHKERCCAGHGSGHSWSWSRSLRKHDVIIRAEEYGAGVVLHCAWSTKDREVFPVGLYPQGEHTLLYASPVLIPGIRNAIL